LQIEADFYMNPEEKRFWFDNILKIS